MVFLDAADKRAEMNSNVPTRKSATDQEFSNSANTEQQQQQIDESSGSELESYFPLKAQNQSKKSPNLKKVTQPTVAKPSASKPSATKPPAFKSIASSSSDSDSESGSRLSNYSVPKITPIKKASETKTQKNLLKALRNSTRNVSSAARVVKVANLYQQQQFGQQNWVQQQQQHQQQQIPSANLMLFLSYENIFNSLSIGEHLILRQRVKTKLDLILHRELINRRIISSIS